MALNGLILWAAFAAGLTLVSAQAGLGCNEEDMCLGSPPYTRCLQTTKELGIPCTLDYAYNSTGYCSCQAQSCVRLTAQNKTSNKQLLVIGDSISLGYQGQLAANLSSGWEVTHAPSFADGDNNDNANWGRQCVEGWISGNNPGEPGRRWDAVTINFGLHDLAFPDNEHLPVGAYTGALATVFAQAARLVDQDTAIVWNTITPVPTNPNASCVLIPGRLESDVLAYNTAALAALALSGLPAGRVHVCDLHKVITDVCGVGYASCPIAQCAGPHFSSEGFALLGNAVAGCVSQAVADRRAALGALGVLPSQ